MWLPPGLFVWLIGWVGRWCPHPAPRPVVNPTVNCQLGWVDERVPEAPVAAICLHKSDSGHLAATCTTTAWPLPSSTVDRVGGGVRRE